MISIIVPARNGAKMSERCLRAVLYSCHALQLRAQFILIDDASDPSEGIAGVFQGTKAVGAAHDFLLVRAKSRLHYSRAFGVGLHFADRENVLFLSNDMALTPHFLMAVLGVASLSRRFGIVRGTSNYIDSHPEHIVEPPHPLSKYADIALFAAARFEQFGFDFEIDRLLSGDAVLIRRDVIDAVGVLDCRFFGYFGDIDFGMRAHLAGFDLVCAKGAWLQHHGGGYIKIEAARSGRDIAELMADRTKVVEAAYQEFREKWDPGLPNSAYEVEFNDYNAFSERAPLRPMLKCEVQQSIINNLIIG